MRFLSKWALALIVPAFVVLMCCRAAPPAKERTAAPAVHGLIVHEWGTFSTFSGSNGKNLKFNPYDNDLPDFVHGYQQQRSKEGPRGGTISLETPVIYFYSERDLISTVEVEFPRGTITEWYPHAGQTEKKLVWKGIEVLPQAKLRLPAEEKESRYCAARETDSAPVRVTFTDESAKSKEQEKFLFYRGVGDFDMPLSVHALGGGKFTVNWNGDAPKGDMILVQVQAGKVRFQLFRPDRSRKGSVQADVQLPDADATVDKLSEAVVKRLTETGLYEKEARAMVATWKSAWFGEEGTRVLYVLPAELTDELLPLRVDPKPTERLRVLVGRHDVLTPEREKQIDSLVAEVNRPTLEQDAKQRAAWQQLVKLGRYHGAAQQAAEARVKKDR